MAAGDFDACRAWIRPEEGLRSNDPDDPGGKTYEGIEQREYDAWLHLHGQPPADVYKASDTTITAIYLAQYWNPYCPVLPPGVALVFFDTNVNQGQSVAVTFLQRALRIEADGHFGVVTASAVKRINQPGGAASKAVIDSMTLQRISRYHGTKGFWKFGEGWLNRAKLCREEAYKMAGVA
jgi:lysozyme family protein